MNTLLYHTKLNTIIATVERNRLVIRSRSPKLKISFAAEHVFDLLKDNLSVRSTNLGVRRRARQLNGEALFDVINSMQRYAKKQSSSN